MISLLSNISSTLCMELQPSNLGQWNPNLSNQSFLSNSNWSLGMSAITKLPVINTLLITISGHNHLYLTFGGKCGTIILMKSWLLMGTTGHSSIFACKLPWHGWHTAPVSVPPSFQHLSHSQLTHWLSYLFVPLKLCEWQLVSVRPLFTATVSRGTHGVCWSSVSYASVNAS